MHQCATWRPERQLSAPAMKKAEIIAARCLTRQRVERNVAPSRLSICLVTSKATPRPIVTFIGHAGAVLAGSVSHGARHWLFRFDEATAAAIETALGVPSEKVLHADNL
jgi:hypothetical protein